MVIIDQKSAITICTITGITTDDMHNKAVEDRSEEEVTSDDPMAHESGTRTVSPTTT